MSERDDFEKWLHEGIGNKWISVPVCVTHNFDELMTEDEVESWGVDAEICIPVARLKGLEGVL